MTRCRKNGRAGVGWRGENFFVCLKAALIIIVVAFSSSEHSHLGQQVYANIH